MCENLYVEEDGLRDRKVFCKSFKFIFNFLKFGVFCLNFVNNLFRFLFLLIIYWKGR